MTPIYVSLAGSVGAVTRFVLDGHLRAKFGSGFPWATIIINVSGSFILGALTGLSMKNYGLANVQTVLGIGFCGGYTTFSTASFETVRLMERRQYASAAINAVGTLVATTLAAAFGIIVGRLY